MSESALKEKLEPGAVEVRLFENVALGDVAAALPYDLLVTVASRATVRAEGVRHIDDVEHVILLPEEAFEHLRQLGRLERQRRAANEPRPVVAVQAADLGRRAAVWEERAETFEKYVARASANGADGSAERRLGVLCRQAASEFAGLRDRVDGAELAGAA